MNNYIKSITSILRFNVVVRDCLEYLVKKEKYEEGFYEYKKQVLLNELTQQTPLKVCLENSGEAGTTLKTKIEELNEFMFGEESTMIKKRPEGISVDHAQHVALFQQVLPIHEEIRKIIDAHIAGAIKANEFNDEELKALIKADDYFYRLFVATLLIEELSKLFFEYNKARSEAKGKVTPQSNFIQNDLNEVIKALELNRKNSRVTSSKYYEVIDPLFALMEMTGGRRDLPEGKTFQAMFQEVVTKARSATVEAEKEWKNLYQPYMNKFFEETKKVNAA